MERISLQTSQTGTKFPNGRVTGDVLLLGPDGNPLGGVSSPLTINSFSNQLALSGDSFFAPTPVVPMTLTLGILRAVISNPPTSTVNAVINSLQITGSPLSQTIVASAQLNPTTNLPATSAQIINAKAGGDQGSLQMKYDAASASLSGGSILFPVIVNQPFNTTLILTPGNYLGINVPFLVATNAQITIFYSEVNQ